MNAIDLFVEIRRSSKPACLQRVSSGPEGLRHVARGASPWLSGASASPRKPQRGDIELPMGDVAPPGLRRQDTGRIPGACAPGYTTRPLWGQELRKLLALIALFLVSDAGVARGELTVVEETNPSGPLRIFKLTVTPAAEPTPALKHRLTLREADFKPGNAAVHYLRAFPEGGVENHWKQLYTKYGEEEVISWYEGEIPLDKLPMDKARPAAATFDSIIKNFVTPACERRDCDWGHGIVGELSGPEFFGFLLPEIQSMRALARALALVTRVAIADRDYERAIALLRMNYRTGVNVGKSPFLVSSLVGVAICGVANEGTIELMAAKDSPNLYWALAELPRPLVSMRDAMRYELAFDNRVFPVLKDPETAEHTPEEWGRMIAEGFRQWGPLTGEGPNFDEIGSQFAATGASLAVYPAAKRRLVASGMDRQVVEKMPVGQVVVIDANHEFRRIADEIEKWQYSPYRDALGRFDDQSLFRGQALEGGLGTVIAKLLLPAVEAARRAELRLAWQLDAMQAVEAIRMHAAKTGKLPDSLDQITVVPVPRNPLTEKPFEYKLDGDTATLDLPASDGMTVAWRFEIKLAN